MFVKRWRLAYFGTTAALTSGVLTGLVGMSPAHAEPVSLTLDYTCTFPLINQQALKVAIDVDLPTTTQQGVPTPAFAIKAISTISANTTSGLALIGAKSIEGKAISHVNVQAPGVNLPDIQVPVAVDKTAVPASGEFSVPAAGETPSLTFPQAGTATIDVGNLDLNMIARNSAGTPIALPGGHADGSFDAPCTVNPGQDTRLTSITIEPPVAGNTAPAAQPVSASTKAGTPVGITLLGSDADGDTLTYTAGQAAHGTVAVDGSTATYTPAEGFTGTDTFSYTVSDGTDAATADVTVTVDGGTVEPPPTGASLTLDYTCTYPLIGQKPLKVAIDAAVPAEAKVGEPTPQFDITAVSTIGGDTTMGLAMIGAKTIEGTAVSHTSVTAPGLTNPDLQVPVAVAKTSVPASGDFTVPASGQAPSLTFPEAGNGVIEVGALDLTLIPRNAAGEPIALPGAHADGSFDAPCTVNPGQSQKLAEFPITGGVVVPENHAPTAEGVAATTDAEQAVTVALKGADVDGDALTYTAGEAAHGTVTVDGANAVYTPAAGFSGTDSFSYTVSDGTEEATATVSVEVKPVVVVPENHAPTAEDLTASTDAGHAVVVALKGADVDGDELTYTVGTAAHGTVTVDGASASYTPAAGFAGVDSFTYTVSDGTEEATATVQVQVAPVIVTPENHAPTAGKVQVKTSAGRDVTVALMGADVDGDALTYQLSGVDHGTATVQGSTVVFTPAAGFTGREAFAYTVSDGELQATGTVAVVVTKAPTKTRATPELLKVRTGDTARIRVKVDAKYVEPTGRVTISYRGRTLGTAKVVDGVAKVVLSRQAIASLPRGGVRLHVVYLGSKVAGASDDSVTVRRVR